MLAIGKYVDRNVDRIINHKNSIIRWTHYIKTELEFNFGGPDHELKFSWNLRVKNKLRLETKLTSEK